MGFYGEPTAFCDRIPTAFILIIVLELETIMGDVRSMIILLHANLLGPEFVDYPLASKFSIISHALDVTPKNFSIFTDSSAVH
jgi:hypothetical protein